MKQSLRAEMTIYVRWNNDESKIIEGMNRQISRFYPSGPLDIDNFDVHKRNYKEWELGNLNFLLSKMLEKYDEEGIIEDHDTTYNVDTVKSMFDETEKALENHDKAEKEISEIVDRVN